MSVTIREFRRDDRDQLTWLVNLHVSAVLPGVALSTNVVMAQLEREPQERVVDPWVSERRCLVAVSKESVVGASLLLRYADAPDVRDAYRGVAEIRWLIFQPAHEEAAKTLLEKTLEVARGWHPAGIHADGALPAPGCYGIPDSWPHVRQLLVDSGFVGPIRTEQVMAAHCKDLTGRHLEGTQVVRSVGELGARLELLGAGESLGFIEVGEIEQALSRSTSAVAWTDVGNLSTAKPDMLEEVMPALLSTAADWLLLGGVERLIDYYAADVNPSEYLAVLERCGFTRLSMNERGWELKI